MAGESGGSRYLLRRLFFVRCGACLELLWLSGGVGDRRWAKLWLWAGAILYIDKVKVRVGKKVLW